MNMQMQQVMSWPTCCARNVHDHLQNLELRLHFGPCEMVLVNTKGREKAWFCVRCQVTYPDDRTDGMLGDQPCPDCGKTRLASVMRRAS